MRARNRFVVLTLLTFTAATSIRNRPAQAAAVASDNACNAPYNGTNWSNGQNGGTGFGAWSLFQSGIGTSSFFTASASDNGGNCSSGGGINGSCGESWGEFASSGAVANARRTFTGTPSALVANQSFTFSIDNGYVNNSGGAVGVALENSSSNTVWEFLYVGGNNGGFYSINDGAGSNDTSVGYTEGGMVVVFTVTTNATYSVTITPVGSSTTSVTGTLQNAVGGQGISQFRFYNNEPLSGNGCNYNAFLNFINVACPTFTVSASSNQTVCVGSAASFSVSASGVSMPTYQWQVSTNGGTTWNPVSSGAGGTTTNYTTAATVAGSNGNMYECAVSAPCGNTITSAPSTLTVVAAPAITTQPTSQTVYAGGSATFSVVASEAASYQWYEGSTGSGVALGDGGTIGGSGNAMLVITGFANGDNGDDFFVVATGCSGQTTSAVATVTVLPDTPPYVTMPMTPASFSDYAGTMATFTAAFSGPGPITYQWMFNNGTSNVVLSVDTTTALSLTNLQVSNSGMYTLVASNAYGTNSVSAQVTVIPFGAYDVQGYFSSEYHPEDLGWFSAPWSQSDPGWRYQLSPQPNLQMTQPGGPTNNAFVIAINPAMTNQTVTGIGTSLEQTSIYTMQLNRADDEIKDLLRQLVDPNTGIGMSLFRVCIGTSDFSCGTNVDSNPQGWYSYQDVQNGPFSITNDVQLGIIRVIQLAQQVLEEDGLPMQIFGSAWSPPGWMKDSGVLTGGNLLTNLYTQAYATYLNNFVLAYEELGIPIYAVTVNNEHYFSTSAYPSCMFDANAEGALVEAIGSQFKTNGLNTKIWILDHNWSLQSDAQQTLSYLKTSTPNGEGYGFCDATAFHHYAGDPTQMTTLHDAYPDKNIQCTEGAVWGTAGVNEIIQDFRNWSQSYVDWVTMVSQVPACIEGPYNSPGPLDPTLFIQNTGNGTNYYRIPEYFLIGQLSKFVRPGAVVIASTSGTSSTLTDVAFRNPDGRIVLVVDNETSSAQNFVVLCQGNQITSTIPFGTVATYLFNAGVTSTNPAPPYVSVETKPDGTGVVVPAQSITAGNSNTVYAIARTAGGGFIANIPVTWSLQNNTGSVSSGDLVPSTNGVSATFTAHLVGSAVIQANAAGPTGQSGVQTVVTGAVSRTTVETAPDGSGVVVPAQSLTAGSSVTPYAIARDAGGNFLSNPAATWSLQNITGGVVSGDLVPAAGNMSASFTGHLLGSAVIQAVANTFAGQSGTLVVNPGPVTQLIWSRQPGSAVSGTPFGQQPVLETADQVGNPSTVGLAPTLNVSVALNAGTGPLLGTTNYNIGTFGNNGVVNFTDFQINAAGSNDQLIATLAISNSTPASVTNCQLWLDANDLSTVTLSNGLVTTWADKSGNSDNAMAGTAPTIATNANLSGAGRVVRFNGSNAYLNVSLSVLTGQPYTIIAMEVDGNKSGQNSYFIGNTGGSTDQALHMGYYNNTTFRLGQWADDLSYNGVYTSTTTPRLWSGKLDTTAGRFLYLDGSQVATLGSTNTVSGALASGHIGAAFDTSGSFYEGDLAEIAVYNRALSDAERTSVENYFEDKWLPGYSRTAVSGVFTVQAAGSQTNNVVNQISGIQLFSGSNVAITVLSTTGETYQLQYSGSMQPANWIDVGGAVVSNSVGNILTLTNFGGASQTQGFYRFHITAP
jgi:glucosylceramidase